MTGDRRRRRFAAAALALTVLGALVTGVPIGTAAAAAADPVPSAVTTADPGPADRSTGTPTTAAASTAATTATTDDPAGVPSTSTMTTPAMPPPATSGAPATAAATSTTTAASTTPATSTTADTAAAVATSTSPAPPTARPAPTDLRIMNWYPADASWTAMWTSYSHARTDTDFAAIASLGATTVRVIVQPKGVGWPTVTAAGAAALRDMVDTAAGHGLTVQLTLFDLWYSWSDIAASKAWTAQLLSPYRDDPRIVLVELENEMSFTHAPAVSWAQEMLPYLATVLPGVPRSLSTNTAAAVRALGAAIPASSLEVIDIHLYGDLGAMPGYIAAARTVAAGRPVIVGEAGRTTGDGRPTGAEQGQLGYFRAVAQLVRDSGIGVFAPWTLTDFVPDTMPAAFRTASEASFGLRRLDGSWKPATDVVREMFGATGVPAVDPSRPAAAGLDIDGGFERSDAEVSPAGRFGAWRVFDAPDITSVGARADSGVTGAAMMLSGTGGSTSMVPAVCQTFLLLSGARTVTASASVRLVSATGFSRIAIAWFDGATYLGSSESVNAVNFRTDWQRLSVTGRAPAAATSFQVHLKSAYNSGTAWFDDVTLA